MVQRTSALEGFGDRMRTFLVAKPLLVLGQKQRFKDYDLSSLGLAVLLFVLEHMLQSSRGCTREAIARFLRETIHDVHDEWISEQEASELESVIVQELRNDGKPFEYQFLDLDQRGPASTNYHLLEYEEYDIRQRTVCLKLSTEAIDLLFKTKEVYQELKISITQLYLQQQIVKGVFDGALRTVQELRLQVRDLKGEIEKLKEKIRADAKKVSRERLYDKTLNRVQEQLSREKRTFAELDDLITKTSERMTSLSPAIEEGKREKDHDAREKVVAVQRELRRVMVEHEALFYEKIDILTLMLNSVEASILHAFRTKINFNREILIPFINERGDPRFLPTVLQPFMPLHRPKSFPLSKIAERQVLRTRSDGEEEGSLIALDEAELEEEIAREKRARLEQERKLYRYLQILIEPLVSKGSSRLSEALMGVASQSYEEYLQLGRDHDFLCLLVHLHQMGVIHLRRGDELAIPLVETLPRMLVKLSEDSEDIWRLQEVSVRPTPDTVRLSSYTATDFVFTRLSNEP